MCFSKLLKVLDSSYETLTYHGICPFDVHYESVMVYITGPCCFICRMRCLRMWKISTKEKKNMKENHLNSFKGLKASLLFIKGRVLQGKHSLRIEENGRGAGLLCSAWVKPL